MAHLGAIPLRTGSCVLLVRCCRLNKGPLLTAIASITYDIATDCPLEYKYNRRATPCCPGINSGPHFSIFLDFVLSVGRIQTSHCDIIINYNNNQPNQASSTGSASASNNTTHNTIYNNTTTITTTNFFCSWRFESTLIDNCCMRLALFIHNTVDSATIINHHYYTARRIFFFTQNNNQQQPTSTSKTIHELETNQFHRDLLILYYYEHHFHSTHILHQALEFTDPKA